MRMFNTIKAQRIQPAVYLVSDSEMNSVKQGSVALIKHRKNSSKIVFLWSALLFLGSIYPIIEKQTTFARLQKITCIVPLSIK